MREAELAAGAHAASQALYHPHTHVCVAHEEAEPHHKCVLADHKAVDGDLQLEARAGLCGDVAPLRASRPLALINPFKSLQTCSLGLLDPLTSLILCSQSSYVCDANDLLAHENNAYLARRK